jgi:antitoxin CptB
MNIEKLKWACRRGMLELDILFQRYLEHRYPEASADEQAQFLSLLTCGDQDLFDWLMNKREPDVEHRDMVRKVQQVQVK